MRILIMFLMTPLLMVTSCKNESKVTSEQVSTQEEVVSKQVEAPIPIEDSSNDEKLVGSGDIPPFLTNLKWSEDGVVGVKGQDDKAIYKDDWYIFDDQYKYSKGKGEKTTGTGKYGYNTSKSIITLIPDDLTALPKEQWKVNQDGPTMIWIGSKKYKHGHGYQMRLHGTQL